MFVCTVPSLSLAGTSRELVLVLFVCWGRHSATVCSPESISCGKRSKLEGVQVKSGGWHTWHFKAGWGNWACLGCTRDLIALFHLGDYRGDRARLSLKMPRERTRASSCNFLQGKSWPQSREKGFSQWEGVRQWKRPEGWWDLCASDSWNKALGEPWSDFKVNLVPNSWGGLLEVIHCLQLLK